MRNTLKIDFDSKTIIMDRTFAAKAKDNEPYTPPRKSVSLIFTPASCKRNTMHMRGERGRHKKAAATQRLPKNTIIGFSTFCPETSAAGFTCQLTANS